MRPYIFVCANSKGGVGKTTTTIGLGCSLAETGKKTLLIDLDHQGNLSDDFGRGDEDYTITDLFENPKFDINKIIFSAKDEDKDIDNLDIIPADITLAIHARQAEKFTHRLTILEDAIKKIKTEYDYILIDLRPAIDLPIENALLIADKVLIPIDIDKRALKGIDDLFNVIMEVKRSSNVEYKIIKNKVNKSHKIMLEDTNKSLLEKKYNVANTEIRMSELYKQATAKRRPNVLFGKNDKPDEDYKALANELLEEMED